jgi:hypothetical protein
MGSKPSLGCGKPATMQPQSTRLEHRSLRSHRPPAAGLGRPGASLGGHGLALKPPARGHHRRVSIRPLAATLRVPRLGVGEYREPTLAGVESNGCGRLLSNPLWPCLCEG